MTDRALIDLIMEKYCDENQKEAIEFELKCGLQPAEILSFVTVIKDGKLVYDERQISGIASCYRKGLSKEEMSVILQTKSNGTPLFSVDKIYDLRRLTRYADICSLKCLETDKNDNLRIDDDYLSDLSNSYVFNNYPESYRQIIFALKGNGQAVFHHQQREALKSLAQTFFSFSSFNKNIVQNDFLRIACTNEDGTPVFSAEYMNRYGQLLDMYSDFPSDRLRKKVFDSFLQINSNEKPVFSEYVIRDFATFFFCNDIDTAFDKYLIKLLDTYQEKPLFNSNQIAELLQLLSLEQEEMSFEEGRAKDFLPYLLEINQETHTPFFTSSDMEDIAESILSGKSEEAVLNQIQEVKKNFSVEKIKADEASPGEYSFFEYYKENENEIRYDAFGDLPF